MSWQTKAYLQLCRKENITLITETVLKFAYCHFRKCVRILTAVEHTHLMIARYQRSSYSTY